MYRAYLFIIAFSLSILLTGCSSCSRKKNSEGEGQKPINSMVEKLDETPDEAIAGTLNDVIGDSIYLKVKGKVLSYDYTHAKAEGALHGTLTKGNSVSIFPDNKQKVALIYINTTELSGRWFYDQHQHRGFSFNKKGGMSSINNADVCFREWKLLNGKLYIYSVHMQDNAADRHQYDVEEAFIQDLNKSHLMITFQGNTYDCQRPSTKPIMLR